MLPGSMSGGEFTSTLKKKTAQNATNKMISFIEQLHEYNCFNKRFPYMCFYCEFWLYLCV